MPAATYVPSQVGEGYFTDFQAPAAGATDNNKAWLWNNVTGQFAPGVVVLGAAGSSGQVQYNSSGTFAGDAGFTYDAANDRLTVAGGLITPSLRPASNSTTAIQLQNATGTAIISVDTTNSVVGIGTTNPGSTLDIVSTANIPLSVGKSNSTGSNVALAQYINTHPTQGNGSSTYNIADLVVKSGNGVVDVRLRSEYDSYVGGVFGTQTNHPMAVMTNGTEKMRIAASGEVGIRLLSPTALLDIDASNTSRSSLRIRSGVAPTSPNDGDIWFDGADFKCRINGITKIFTVV